MSKISIVVPTMWFSEGFCDRLTLIEPLDCIGEIIIINNYVSNTPTHSIFSSKKIKMQNMQENIFVNPAWNLGASLSNEDIICFYSDDIDININVFHKTAEFMKQNEDSIGMVGILARVFEHEHHYDRFMSDDSINFVNIKNDSNNPKVEPIGIGNLFFVHKKNWKNVPEQTKIFHGEAFIWNYLNNFKENHIIINCRIFSKFHTTIQALSLLNPDQLGNVTIEDRKYCESVKYLMS